MHPLRVALLLSTLACLAGNRAVGQQPADTRDAWWQAVSRLDLDAARALDEDSDRRAFLDALALALEGGSAAAEAPLCALAAGAADPDLRRRAGQTALNLLRIEARWEALTDFGARCGLSLKDGAIPAALLRLPAETLELPDEPVVLPLLETDLRLPLVTAHVTGPAGEEDLLALVDTGAGACMLTSGAARRLGIEALGEDAIPILGSVGRGALALPAGLPALRLGALRATSLPVLIVDDAAVGALLPGVDLVIGWELLQQVAVEIGGASGELVLRRSTPRPPDVPPNLVLLHEPVVRVASGDAQLLFLLDTGSTSTDATPGLVARLGLTDLPETEDVARGLGAERRASVPVIEQLPLRIGDVTLGLGNVQVWALPDEAGRFPELDGTLGADVPLAVRLVIDGPARRVDLRAR